LFFQSELEPKIEFIGGLGAILPEIDSADHHPLVIKRLGEFDRVVDGHEPFIAAAQIDKEEHQFRLPHLDND
jgi:hypothetical protein